METQESRRPQNDGAPQNACRKDKKTAQPSNNPIRNAQVRGPLPPAIENQQLMANQRGFGNDGTKPAGFRESNYGDDYMKKKSKDVAHAGMVSNLKNPAMQPDIGNSPCTGP